MKKISLYHKGTSILSKKNKSNKGISLVEVVVAIAIFSVLSTVAYQTYITVNRLTVSSDKKDVAVRLAEEGIEAMRSIRDYNFTSLPTIGTIGIVIGATSTWQASGTSDVTNGYIRTLTFTPVDADTTTITSKVDWLDRGATSTLTLNSTLTNWEKIVLQSAGLTINTTGANLSQAASRRLLTGITLAVSATSSTTTINQVNVSWTTAIRRLQEIRSPNGTLVFGPVSVVSGATSTLSTSISMNPGTSKTIEFYFDSTMATNTITITFIMTDGSIKTVVITNPPIGT